MIPQQVLCRDTAVAGGWAESRDLHHTDTVVVLQLVVVTWTQIY